MFAGSSETSTPEPVKVKEEMQDDRFPFDKIQPCEKVFIKVEPDLPPLSSEDESSENAIFTQDGITSEGNESRSAEHNKIPATNPLQDGVFISTDVEMNQAQLQNSISTGIPLDADKFCLVKDASSDGVPYRIVAMAKPTQSLYQPIAMKPPDVPYECCKLCTFRTTDADRLAAHELTHGAKKKIIKPKKIYMAEDGSFTPNRQKDSWNHDMTLLLLRLVKANMHAFKFLSTRNLAFAGICEEFKDRGYDWISHAEMKKKWSNLLTTYRRIRARRYGKRGLHTGWPYYLLVDDLVGKQKESVLDVDELDFPAGENDPSVGCSRELYQFVAEDAGSNDEGSSVRLRENKNNSSQSKLNVVTRQTKLNASKEVIINTLPSKSSGNDLDPILDDITLQPAKAEPQDLQQKLDTMSYAMKEMSEGLSEMNENLKTIATGLQRFMNSRK